MWFAKLVNFNAQIHLELIVTFYFASLSFRSKLTIPRPPCQESWPQTTLTSISISCFPIHSIALYSCFSTVLWTPRLCIVPINSRSNLSRISCRAVTTSLPESTMNSGTSINPPINQSINQSIDRSIIQSINQPINHSIDYSINQSTDKSIN